VEVIDEGKYVRGEITARREVADGLAIWRVRLDGGSIPFRPGQYVAMGLPLGDRMLERPYSICSAPGEAELEFFIELVPGGALTSRLFALPPGGAVYLRRAAKGRFLLDPGVRRHLMVASVTGAAPFVSILRDLSRRGESPARVLLVHSASTPGELGYDQELTTLSQACSWFSYVPTISRPWLAPEWPGERGRAEDIVRKHADREELLPGRATVYCCGNPRMIRNVKAVMERAGFAGESVREEMYWAPRVKSCD
jgi:ferredoxin--NADP+ reductase